MKASLGNKLQALVSRLTLWGLKKAGERSSVVCGLIVLSESQGCLLLSAGTRGRARWSWEFQMGEHDV